MIKSDNSFARHSFSEASGSMADASPGASSNTPAIIILSVCPNGWSGINLYSSALGFDEIHSGTPLGMGELGGLKHFE